MGAGTVWVLPLSPWEQGKEEELAGHRPLPPKNRYGYRSGLDLGWPHPRSWYECRNLLEASDPCLRNWYGC